MPVEVTFFINASWVLTILQTRCVPAYKSTYYSKSRRPSITILIRCFVGLSAVPAAQKETILAITDMTTVQSVSGRWWEIESLTDRNYGSTITMLNTRPTDRPLILSSKTPVIPVAVWRKRRDGGNIFYFMIFRVNTAHKTVTYWIVPVRTNVKYCSISD